MKKFFAVIISLALLAFAVPASAQEGDVPERLKALEEAFQCSWKFYGSARMATFWYKDDAATTGTGFDDTDLDWSMHANSRIGASVKLGDVAGRFEYGHTAANGATLRLLFGEWNFGPGKLLLGQDYTPMTFWVSNQVANGDNCLLGYGQMYTGRQQQIKLTFGAFQFAAIRPNAIGVTTTAAPFGAAWQNDLDTTIPKLEASYDIKAGPLAARISGAYQSYDAVAIVPNVSEKDYSVDSYQVALGAKYDMSPFFMKGSIYMGQNIRNLGQSSAVTSGDRAYYDAGTDSIWDSDTIGLALIAGFKLNDTWIFELGYGLAKNEVESGGFKRERDVKSYYLNATINLAKGVFVVPEIGKYDYGDLKQTGVADADQGSTKYFGAKWQINF